MPKTWATQIDTSNKTCATINAEFQNVGERMDENGAVILDGRLGDFVFSRYLHEGQPARTLELKSDPSTGVLVAKLVGDSSRTFRFQVLCDAGWHVVSFERSDTYLGEGVVEEQFEQISAMRQDREGRLVARVKMKGEFRSLHILGSAASSEGWYRFEPVK